MRAKTNLRWKVLVEFGPGDVLVEMKVSKPARRANPELPRTWRARVITYQRAGHEPQTLLTSLLDPRLYPAEEIIELYHERWEY